MIIFFFIFLIKSTNQITINSNYNVSFCYFSYYLSSIASSILCQTSNVNISVSFCSFFSCWATSENAVFLYSLGFNANTEKCCFVNCSATQRSVGTSAFIGNNYFNLYLKMFP